MVHGQNSRAHGPRVYLAHSRGLGPLS
uniref:Uncharacterized protein n=1 Tax=Rhizophora mucronata TaxID=61149 RepID=A0A2P2QBN0_RHIMU